MVQQGQHLTNNRASVIRDPQPVPGYIVSSAAGKHVADVQRNAIAQQLVQHSLHNSQAQRQRMSQGQQQVIQRLPQQLPQQHQQQLPDSLMTNQAQLAKLMSQESRTLSRAGSVQPPPPSYTHSQTMPRLQPHVSRSSVSQQSPYLYTNQTAATVLQHNMTNLQNTRTLSKTPSLQSSDYERTYMNVHPVAMVARNGRVMKPGETGQVSSSGEDSNKNKTPAIPKSQEVKHKQEPLYSTILGVAGSEAPPPLYEEGGMYANYAPASLYSNYSNYSELEMLRSCDSHCSGDEEHTEGLPPIHGADSPVSSSYSELRHAHVLSGNIPQYNNVEGDYEPVIPPKGQSVLAAQQQKHFKSLSNSSSDSDYLGTCVKCGDRILGEGTGCSAMGRPYHILCFTCSGRKI